MPARYIPETPTKETLAKLKAKLDVYTMLEQRERCQDSLLEFIKCAWPYIDSSPFQYGWGIEAMCDHLEAVTLGHISKLLINIPPRPVSDDALVLSKRGLIPLRSIIVGDLVWTHKGRWRAVTAVHDQGELDVLKLTTKRGYSVDAEATHPFLTPDGWENLGDIKFNDVVGLVPCREECGESTISVQESRLLGYLIGDGSCVGTPTITSADDAVTTDIIDCAASIGFIGKEFKYKITKTGYWLRRIAVTSNVRKGGRKGDFGPVRNWLSDRGLWGGTSYTKLVPDVVMRGSNDIVRAFLGSYWSCDGHISLKGVNTDGTARKDLRIGCNSVNKAFIQQIQLLLWRLGVQSVITKKVANLKTKRQGDIYVSFGLDINTQDDCWRFTQLIDIKHNRADKLKELHKIRFDFDRQLWGESVKTIESIGTKKCICLTVDEDASFTANGFAVHNCTKTKTVSILFPAWTWARTHDIAPLSGPQVKFLCASYSDKLTLLSSNEFRRLVQSPWYQKLFPLKFMKDQNTKGHMDNDKGGSRQSTSVGGTLLGIGGIINIGDDLNNTEKASGLAVETGANRERAKNFWDEFRSTRINDPEARHHAIINVQQRVHQEDVSGHWLSKDDDIVHLMIPMRHDPARHCVTVRLPQYESEDKWEDPRPRDSEDLMWPERFNDFYVRSEEKALGPYLASGRLQQEPHPKGGGIIQRAWWQPWDKIEAQKYGLEWHGGLREMPHMELVVASLDTAFKEKEENDFNSLTVWGIFLDLARNRRAMLMYAWNKRLPLHGKAVQPLPGELPIVFKERQKNAMGLVDLIAFTCKKYNVKRLLIEDKSRGHDVANELRRLYSRENWGVQLVNPVGDKVSRAHSIVPLFTDDAIYAPNDNIAWAESVIDQCESFPKGSFDDQVDSVTQFLLWARDNEILVRADEASAYQEEQSTFKHREDSVAQLYGV
jgi:predicted phage terminase large subunit-like protein